LHRKTENYVCLRIIENQKIDNMRLLTYFFAGIITMLVLSSGCKKDNSVTPTGSMTAKINGASWSASIISDTIQNGTITISGKSQDNSLIWINLNQVRTGVFTLNDSSIHTASYYSGDGISSYTTSYGLNASGQVNITGINYNDSLMSGTFSFIGVSPIGGEKQIADGKFNELHFKMPLVSSFHVDIDGVLWNAGIISGYLLMQSRLTLKGSVNDGTKFVSIVVPGNITSGTYHLGTLLDNYYGQYNPDSLTNMYSYDGTLTITKHNTTINRIEGSFNFHAMELQGSASINLSAGVFKVTYIEN